MNHITRYNDKLRPIRWSYVDVTRRITGTKQSLRTTSVVSRCC
jgi:hypothetical protein